MSASRPSTSRLAVVVVGLGVVAVAGVLLAGPVQWTLPDWAGGPTQDASAPAVVDAPTLAPTPMPTVAPATMGGNAAILWIIGTVLALIVTFVLWRTVRRILERRGEKSAPPEAPEADLGELSDPQTERAAPIVLRGIARALATLDESRDPSDAVVHAWLGVEDAAAGSGIRRERSETPSEFAGRVLARVDADRAAARDLLRLYQDVRFGGHPADRKTVRIARDCLLRLQESWHEPAGMP